MLNFNNFWQILTISLLLSNLRFQRPVFMRFIPRKFLGPLLNSYFLFHINSYILKEVEDLEAMPFATKYKKYYCLTWICLQWHRFLICLSQIFFSSSFFNLFDISFFFKLIIKYLVFRSSSSSCVKKAWWRLYVSTCFSLQVWIWVLEV